MLNINHSLQEDYWEEFQLEDEDIEFIYNISKFGFGTNIAQDLARQAEYIRLVCHFQAPKTT